MAMKYIPRPIQDSVRAFIRKVAKAGCLLYLPYQAGDDAFAIPKPTENGSERCEYGLPVPPTDLFLGYGATSAVYLASGKDSAETMFRLLADSGFALAEGARVLDFGCGAGRMLRHLHPLAASHELWGVDISSDCIFWCRQHLSPPFLFATTTTIPHLPFEDRYFDLVYCGSVFTHIDDLAQAWLLELRRVLSSEARLYLTIHDHHSVELLDGPWSGSSLAAEMKRHEIYLHEKNDSAMLSVGRGAESIVFYDLDYFLKMVNPIYQVLSVTPGAYGYQTGLVLSKK